MKFYGFEVETGNAVRVPGGFRGARLKGVPVYLDGVLADSGEFSGHVVIETEWGRVRVDPDNEEVFQFFVDCKFKVSGVRVLSPSVAEVDVCGKKFYARVGRLGTVFEVVSSDLSDLFPAIDFSRVKRAGGGIVYEGDFVRVILAYENYGELNRLLSLYEPIGKRFGGVVVRSDSLGSVVVERGVARLVNPPFNEVADLLEFVDEVVRRGVGDFRIVSAVYKGGELRFSLDNGTVLVEDAVVDRSFFGRFRVREPKLLVPHGEDVVSGSVLEYKEALKIVESSVGKRVSRIIVRPGETVYVLEDGVLRVNGNAYK